MGQTVPLCIGQFKGLPARYINAETDQFDYLLGLGVGLDGGNFKSITRVLRDDAPYSTYTGIAQGGTFQSVTLSVDSLQSEDFYKDLWITLTSPFGDVFVERITGYANNIATLSNPISLPIESGWLYDIRDYRFFDGSQSLPYPGYAFLRFLTPQSKEGRLQTIFVDGVGLEYETNLIRAIEFLLTSPAFGLQLGIHNDSFDIYASDEFIESIKLGGVILERKLMFEHLQSLCALREIRLIMTEDNIVRIKPDGPKIAQRTLGFNDGVYNNIISHRKRDVEVSRKLTTLTTRYSKNLKDNTFRLESKVDVSSDGILKGELNLDLVASTDTANKLQEYKSARFRSIASTGIRDVIVDAEIAESLDWYDAILLRVPDDNLVDTWEVLDKVETEVPGQWLLSLVDYLPSVYGISDEVPEELPPDYVPTAPTTPFNVSALNQGLLNVKVSWDKVFGTETYEVWRALGITSNVANASFLAPASTNLFNDTNVSYSTQYTYFIRAVNSVGTSPFSQGASITTSAEPTAPVPPQEEPLHGSDIFKMP